MYTSGVDVNRTPSDAVSRNHRKHILVYLVDFSDTIYDWLLQMTSQLIFEIESRDWLVARNVMGRILSTKMEKARLSF